MRFMQTVQQVMNNIMIINHMEIIMNLIMFY